MRFSENGVEIDSPQSPSNQSKYSQGGLRRSKRSRKCRGDMDIIASSFSTIKDVKLQVNVFIYLVSCSI